LDFGGGQNGKSPDFAKNHPDLAEGRYRISALVAAVPLIPMP